ncbi:MAG TPA: Gfo/Idh/MocA family oxidoreductase [Rectinemataceae bacterium]|nr:Gfo/Idh/MocA family oxidoreductase [Rectinemataceae bacterium]
MSHSVRVGIVGLGRLGRRHAENLSKRVPGVVLVAAASPVAAELEWAEKNLGVAVYTDLSALLGRSDLDAVWLVTPTSLHAEQSIQVLEAGKHLFCEKPLSLDVAPCDRVIEVARRHPKQTSMIGFMRRFDPSYALVKRAVAGVELGTVFRIHCESHDPVDPSGFFVKFAPTSGGIFLDCAIHDIDLTRWMLEGLRPLRVSAYGTRVMYPGLGGCGDVDTAAAMVEFEKGVLASFHVSRTSHRGYEATMSVTGTSGALSCGRNLSELPVIREAGGAAQSTGQTDFFSRFGDAFLHEANAFVEAANSGATSASSLEDAREATRLAVAMRESLEKGAPVSLE